MTQAHEGLSLANAPGVSIVEVTPESAEWPLVARYVRDQTDPVTDLLVWADVLSGIARLSRVWLARDSEAVLGLAFAFPLWPSLPSIGLKGESRDIERAMLAALSESGALTSGFVITDPDQVPVFAAVGNVGDRHEELHMILEARAWRPVDTRFIQPGRLEDLDAFYRAQGAGAWNPVQFETGPYVTIVDGGRIVAAAGTHFAYPELAQIGNVFTDPAHRGLGYASAVTAGVVDALVERGHATVSLFVAEANPGARGIYERLGFREHQRLAAFRWDHLPQS